MSTWRTPQERLSQTAWLSERPDRRRMASRGAGYPARAKRRTQETRKCSGGLQFVFLRRGDGLPVERPAKGPCPPRSRCTTDASSKCLFVNLKSADEL